MALQTWFPVLVSKMEEVDGILKAHSFEDLPAAISASPTMIVLPIEGQFEYSEGGPFSGQHEVQGTLYVTSQLAAEAYKQVVPFIERVRDKLAANISLDNTVATILPSASAPFYDGPGGILYAKKQYLGIIFRWTVKENESGFTVGP